MNNYQWWRNHRRFITLGLLIFLASAYIRDPMVKDFNVKDTCGRFQAQMITKEEAIKRLNLGKKTIHNNQKNELEKNIIYYCWNYN